MRKEEIIEKGVVIGYKFYIKDKLVSIQYFSKYAATIKLKNIKFTLKNYTNEQGKQ